MIFLDVLQMIGLLCGVLGAVLTAGSLPGRRAAGFGIWIVGNISMFTAGIFQGNYYLVLMFGFYAATAIAGLRNNTGGGL